MSGLGYNFSSYFAGDNEADNTSGYTVSFRWTDRVCYVWCNFEPGCKCRSAVIFGPLKDDTF